jgi:hypothetical protein
MRGAIQLKKVTKSLRATGGTIAVGNGNPFLNIPRREPSLTLEHHDLPPKIARNEFDKRRMTDFTLDTLDAYQRECDEDFDKTTDPAALRRSDVQDAKRGNKQALDQLRTKWHPDLKELLHLPKRRGKGDSFPKDPWADPYQNKLTYAVHDADRIRAIWMIYYKTKKLWNYDTPEEITARRWGIDDWSEVVEWKRNKRCPKDPWKILV